MTAADIRVLQPSSSSARRKGRRAGRRGVQAECCGGAVAVWPCRRQRDHAGASAAPVPAKYPSNAMAAQSAQATATSAPAMEPQTTDPLRNGEQATPSRPRSRSRSVSFDSEAASEHEVTPYAEIYGLHPNDFLFERNDCILLLSGVESGSYSTDQPESSDEESAEDEEECEMDEMGEESAKDEEECEMDEMGEDGWVLVHGA